MVGRSAISNAAAARLCAIRVNAIAPGPVWTPFNPADKAKGARSAGSRPAAASRRNKRRNATFSLRVICSGASIFVIFHPQKFFLGEIENLRMWPRRLPPPNPGKLRPPIPLFQPGTAVSQRRCTSMVRWMLMLALLLAGGVVTETQDRPPLQAAPSAQDSPLARITLI
jgi:hypothetical protein